MGKLKKIISISAAVVMILTTMSYLTLIGNAAALSEKWKNLAAYSEAGSVSANNDGSIDISTVGGTSYAQAAITYGDKVKIDGLEITFSLSEIQSAGYNSIGYIFAVALSANAFGDFVNYTAVNNFMSGNTYGIACNTGTTAAFCFYPVSATQMNVFGGMSSLITSTVSYDKAKAVAMADTFTVKFVVNGEKVDTYINSKLIDGLSFNAASVLDANGKAYLAFSNNALGWAGMKATVKTVGGQAANSFAPAAPTGTVVSDKWIRLSAFDADSEGASNGSVTAEENKLILSVPAGMHWPQAGVMFSDAVALDGLSLKIKASAFSYDSANGYFAISLSKNVLGDFTVPGVLGVRTYSPSGSTVGSFILTFYGTNLSVWADGVTGSVDVGPVSGIAPNTDFTITFVKANDSEFKILVNGNVLKIDDGDFTVPMTDVVVGGMTNLSLFACGYGSSGNNSIVISEINSKPANIFYLDTPSSDVSSDTPTSSETPTSSDTPASSDTPTSSTDPVEGEDTDTINGWIIDDGKYYNQPSNGGLVMTAPRNISMALNRKLTGNYTVNVDFKLPVWHPNTEEAFVIGVASPSTDWAYGYFMKVYRTEDGYGIAFVDNTDGQMTVYEPDSMPPILLFDYNTVTVEKSDDTYIFFINGTKAKIAHPAVTDGIRLDLGVSFNNTDGLVDATAINVRDFSITTASGTSKYFTELFVPSSDNLPGNVTVINPDDGNAITVTPDGGIKTELGNEGNPSAYYFNSKAKIDGFTAVINLSKKTDDGFIGIDFTADAPIVVNSEPFIRINGNLWMLLVNGKQFNIMSLDLDEKTDFAVKLEKSGGNVNVYINNTLLGTTQAPAFESGYVAISTPGGMKYNSFTVRSVCGYKAASFSGGEPKNIDELNGDNWSFVPLTNDFGLDAAARSFPIAGIYSLEKDGTFRLATPTWSAGAIMAKKKIATDGLAITLKMNDMIYEPTAGHGVARPYQGYSIVLSSETPVLAANGYSSKPFFDNGIGLKFIKNSSGKLDCYIYKNVAGVETAIATPSSVKFTVADVYTFTFEKSGSAIVIKYTDANGTMGTLATVTDGAALVGEKAALSFAADAFGGANVNDSGKFVLAVNGAAPNWYLGFDGAGSGDSMDPVTPVDVGGKNAGKVALSGPDMIFNYKVGGWFPQAGKTTKEKVTVDGLSVTLRIGHSTVETPLTTFGINLCKNKPTSFGVASNGIYMPSGTVDDTFGTLFYGSGAKLKLVTFENSVQEKSGAVYENMTFTLTFVKVSGNNYAVYIDGVAVKDDGGSNVIADLSGIIDENGKAYLTFFGCGYGADGATAVVSKINGIDASKFDIASHDTALRGGYLVGSQIRTDGQFGLRFLCEIPKNDKFTSIMEYGMLILPSDFLDEAEDLVITKDGNIVSSVKPEGIGYLRIPGAKLYKDNPTNVQFTGVLIGIPENCLARSFTAVAYIVYNDGTVVYTNPLERCVNTVEAISGETIVHNDASSENFGKTVTMASSLGLANNGNTNATLLAGWFAANPNGAVLGIDRNYLINSSITFPANITLYFFDYGSLTINANCTFNTKEIYCDDHHRIFEGTYNILLPNVSYACPEWFGGQKDDGQDDAEAIYKALMCGNGTVKFSAGNYDIKSAINYNGTSYDGKCHHPVLSGEGESTVLRYSGSGALVFGDTYSLGSTVTVKDISFIDENGTHVAVKYNGKHNAYSRMDVVNCNFTTCGIGVYMDYCGGSTVKGCTFTNCTKAIEVGPMAMFLYFTENTATNCGYFVFCDVPESDGVSNGIMISRNYVTGSSLYDVYVTRNQTTFITENQFLNNVGYGCIYMSLCLDDKVFANTMTGTNVAGSNAIVFATTRGRQVAAENTISGFDTGVSLNGTDAGRTRSGNVIAGNTITTADGNGHVVVVNQGEAKIFENTFNGCISGQTAVYGQNAVNAIVYDNVFDAPSGSGLANFGTGVNTYSNGRA